MMKSLPAVGIDVPEWVCDPKRRAVLSAITAVGLNLAKKFVSGERGRRDGWSDAVREVEERPVAVGLCSAASGGADFWGHGSLDKTCG
jgi:hypothetical protein